MTTTLNASSAPEWFAKCAARLDAWKVDFPGEPFLLPIGCGRERFAGGQTIRWYADAIGLPIQEAEPDALEAWRVERLRPWWKP